MPQDLYDRLEQLADENNRSLNAEIVSILDYSVGQIFLTIDSNEASEDELQVQATRYRILVSQLRSLLETDRAIKSAQSEG